MDQTTSTTVGGLLGTAAGSSFGPVGASVGGNFGALAGSLFGSKNNAALQALREAQARIMAIPSPTAEDLKLVLQPLVQQGVLTPDQYQTISQQPSAFTKIDLDPTSRDAELKALSQLQSISDAGGHDAQFESAMNEARNAAGTQARGERDSIMQNAAERGVSNSNLTAAQQLAQASEDAYNLNSQQTQAAASAESRALQALMGSASLGGQINSQDYQQSADRAKAIDAINSYNAQNSQNASNLNTQTGNSAQQYNLGLAQNIAQYNNQNANQAAQYNAQLPETVFQNNLAKASAAAGVSQPIANMLQGQNQSNASFQGSVVGNIGNALNQYATNKTQTQPTPPPSYPSASTPAYQNNTNDFAYRSGYINSPIPAAHGMRVPGEAEFPGDDPRNDKVDARLSPGEVVVPRSASNDPLKLVDFAMHAARPQPNIDPEDVKTVLEALSKHRDGFAYGGRAC